MLVGIAATVAGLVLLAWAADQFVEGAADLAARLRISAVVIGAVVIGMGTSAPELLVSVLAAAQGDREVGVGNIVGSNIANITLVLGGAALLIRIRVNSKAIRRELPLSTAAVALFAFSTWRGFSRIDGLVLLTALVAVLVILVRSTRRERNDVLGAEVDEFLAADHALPARAVALRTFAGFAGTVAGAQILVWGATRMGREFGWSDAFIGLTVVAVGTSLPELVTGVAAARRGEDDIIVGNVLGSNLFNSLAVGGLLNVVSPGTIEAQQLAVGGVMLMLGVAVAAGVLLARGRVARWQAVALLAVYGATLPFLA